MIISSILLPVVLLGVPDIAPEPTPSPSYGRQEIVSVVPLNQHEVAPIGPRPPLPSPTPVPTPSITFSGSYYLVYRPDPNCSPSIQTVTFPSNVKVDCLQDKTKTALLDIVRRYKIDVGHESPCWPFFNESYYSCLDKGMVKPKIAYGMSSHWIRGLRENIPWEGCANGISGDPIFVSMVDPVNELKLISWETANYWIWILMNRVDLTDGFYVSEVVNRVYLECSMVN